MNEAEVLKALKTVKTMPELDALRLDCVRAGEESGDIEVARRIQRAFIKAKNRLQRIPLSERSW